MATQPVTAHLSRSQIDALDRLIASEAVQGRPRMTRAEAAELLIAEGLSRREAEPPSVPEAA